MSKSRIFLVSNMYPSRKMPNFGIFVKKFEDSFLQEGGEVAQRSVITQKHQSKIVKLFVYVRFYLETLFKGLFYARKYDVIYVHYIAHTSIPVFLLSLFLNKKIILNIHGDDILPTTKLVASLNFFIDRLLLKSSLIVVPSDFFRETLISRIDTADIKAKIFISPSGGIDQEVFKPGKGIRATYNIPEKAFVIGFVSRFDEGKGWGLFLDALKQLVAAAHQQFFGLMVGSGPQLTAAKQYISNLGLQKKVLLLEKVPHHELPDIYRSMDIFIFPTMLRESLGLVGLEAMACGIPVIGSDIGGLKTYIKTDFNGYLVEPGNVTEFVKKINQAGNWSQHEKDEKTANCRDTVAAYDAKLVSQLLFNKVSSI